MQYFDVLVPNCFYVQTWDFISDLYKAFTGFDILVSSSGDSKIIISRHSTCAECASQTNNWANIRTLDRKYNCIWNIRGNWKLNYFSAYMYLWNYLFSCRIGRYKNSWLLDLFSVKMILLLRYLQSLCFSWISHISVPHYLSLSYLFLALWSVLSEICIPFFL